MTTASARAAKPAAGTARTRRSAIEPETWSPATAPPERAAAGSSSGRGREPLGQRLRIAGGHPRPRDVHRAAPRRGEPLVPHVVDDAYDRRLPSRDVEGIDAVRRQAPDRIPVR